MEKLLKVAEMRDLEKQVSMNEISYSRMVEIINEKHFFKLVELRQELKQNAKPDIVKEQHYFENGYCVDCGEHYSDLIKPCINK